MSDRYSNLQREYGSEFEDLEFEDMDLEDMEFKTADEFEDTEAYGNSEFEGLEESNEWIEEADPGAYRWPRSRTFKPAPAATIASAPYKTGTGICSVLEEDLMQLTVSVGSFRRSVDLLTKLTRQRPRKQQLIDDTGKKARREMSTLKIILQKMSDQTEKGRYQCSGCTRKDLVKVFSKITKLDGPWRHKNAQVKKLWEQLLCRLKCAIRPCRC